MNTCIPYLVVEVYLGMNKYIKEGESAGSNFITSTLISLGISKPEGERERWGKGGLGERLGNAKNW